MGTLTIAKIDDSTESELRARASRHGQTIEEEARDILHASLQVDQPQTEHLVDSIMRIFGPDNGADDLEIPPRERMRGPIMFDDE